MAVLQRVAAVPWLASARRRTLRTVSSQTGRYLTVSSCRAGRKPRPFSFGATLVEIIIVMLLVGILATVVGVTYKSDESKARYQAERLRTDLRHAQMIALT